MPKKVIFLVMILAICAWSTTARSQVMVGGEDFESYEFGLWTASTAPSANPLWGDGTLSVEIVDSGTTNRNELAVGIDLIDQWSSGVDFDLNLAGNRSWNPSNYTFKIYVHFDPETVQNLTNSTFEMVILNPNDDSQGTWFVFDSLDPSGYEQAKSTGYTFNLPIENAWTHYSKSEPVDVSIPTWRIQIYVGNTQSTNNKPVNFTVDNIAVNYSEPLFINPSGFPIETSWTNSPTLTGTFVDGSGEVNSMELYLNDELVNARDRYAGGSSTNSISYDAKSLPTGSYTGRVVATDISMTNSLSYTWTFNVIDAAPEPEVNPLALFNINFEGSSNADGGGIYPISNGIVAGAPSMGSNNWYNVDYENPWYFGWQSKTIPESSGTRAIPWITYELLEGIVNIEMYIPWSWGSDQASFTAAAADTLWATALGGVNTDMNIELRDLNMDVLYDLYLYFTCPTDSHIVTTTYSITTGSSPEPQVSLSSFQKTLLQGGYEGNYQVNTNYVVITAITPQNGKIGLNVSGDSYGGGISAMQLVARKPIATVIPNIQSITMTNEAVNLSWASQSFISYSIQTKSSLLDAFWSPVSNGIWGVGSSLEVTLPVSEDQKFYKIIGE